MFFFLVVVADVFFLLPKLFYVHVIKNKNSKKEKENNNKQTNKEINKQTNKQTKNKQKILICIYTDFPMFINRLQIPQSLTGLRCEMQALVMERSEIINI